MPSKPSWHIEARAMRQAGASYREIYERFGVTSSAVYKALNPERVSRYAAQSNSQPGRTEAKRAYNRRRTAEHQARYQDRDPAIPGLLPLWDAHNCIVGFTRVDIADWEELRHRRFLNVGTGYACTKIDGKRVYLHHLLVGHVTRGSGLHTDHINRDRSDNRRANIRVVTPAENMHNRGGVYERCWWRQQQAA